MDKPKIKLSPGDSGRPKIRLSPEPEAGGGKTTVIKRRRNNSPNNLLREMIKILVVLGIAGTVYYRYVLVPDERPTGNGAVLAMCGWELSAWKSYQANQPDFNFHQLSADQKRRVIIFGLNQDFLIRTNFLWSAAASREIVIVSQRQYDNVPTPAPWNLFHNTPAHVAGYSDGTTGLIAPAEFDSLFIYGFTSLWSLATNADINFKIFKQ
jgi:hypothetical protein